MQKKKKKIEFGFYMATRPAGLSLDTLRKILKQEPRVKET